MSQTIVSKWGESLAVRLPGDLAEAIGLDDGQQVEIVVKSDTLVIRKLQSTPGVEAMFAGRPPEEWRAIYAAAYDWGPDRGREQIKE